jgi:hypothetical protein
MKPNVCSGLDEAQNILNEAQGLNGEGNAPASIEKAYGASNKIAAVYMREIEGQDLPANDDTYHLFSKAIQQSGRHPKFRDQITGVVRVVYVLHEAYEPALLHETTTKDAQQMIDHVSELQGLIEQVLESRKD